MKRTRGEVIEHCLMYAYLSGEIDEMDLARGLGIPDENGPLKQIEIALEHYRQWMRGRVHREWGKQA